jgi:nucleoside 2-deoxyribosyltransferase
MKPKPFVFTLMPFNESFNDIWKLGIKETCEKADTYCERVDEQIFEERMLDRIYNQINKADIIVADMTGKNPNVFYEVGYAHALNKRVILIIKESDDIPFDLKHHPL